MSSMCLGTFLLCVYVLINNIPNRSTVSEETRKLRTVTEMEACGCNER